MLASRNAGFAAERTLLAWQRCSLALMGFGFVIERFSLFLSVLRRQPENSTHHVFSLIVGIVLILVGAAVALASSMAFRRFVRTLPAQDVPPGSWGRVSIPDRVLERLRTHRAQCNF